MTRHGGDRKAEEFLNLGLRCPDSLVLTVQRQFYLYPITDIDREFVIGIVRSVGDHR
jgi:hypothetical protein